MSKKYNVLSLFDGVACGRVALDRAGIGVNQYFASEIDKYAIQVSKKNWPGIIHLGDVTKINVESLPQIDLIFGGPPCQSHSTAGKQGGFNDPRGQLFFDALRILREIQTKNPNVKFLFENVKMKKESADLISKELGVEPITINSSLLSAQNRVRMYWSNIPNLSQPEDAGIKLCSIIESGIVDREKAYCIDANYFKGGNLKQYFEKSRRQLVFLNEEKTEFRKLSVSECEKLQTLPVGYCSGISDTQAYKCIGNGWTVDVIAHLLKGFC
jgi:DNA (cytosine-5)-methyltransferase 1